MRMIEGKKLEHKPTMKKLADVTPKERRQAEEWMAMDPREIINNIVIPALAGNIDEIKALKMRGGLLEKMVIILGAIVVGFAACVAFL